MLEEVEDEILGELNSKDTVGSGQATADVLGNVRTQMQTMAGVVKKKGFNGNKRGQQQALRRRKKTKHQLCPQSKTKNAYLEE